MTVIEPALLKHILSHLPLLLNRDFLLDLFTTIKKTKATRIDATTARPEPGGYIYDGKFLDIDGQLHIVYALSEMTNAKGQAFNVTPLGIATRDQLVERNSQVILTAGDIRNYNDTEPLTTTMGRLLLNYAIFVDPFDDMIPYLNKLWSGMNRIESTYIFDGLRTTRITVDDVKRYSRNIHFIGHFTELSVPSFSEKSLTIDPAIIARRDELLKENRAAIDAGDVVVMSKIEAELIAMDRASLRGDPSARFYDRDNKSYNVARKGMYLLGGLVPGFGTKDYGFVENSLQEGWDTKKFPILCNEIRRGSYNRAKETAKGGEETKFIIRVFQNTEVTEEDCHTDRYLPVRLYKATLDKYLYRNIQHGDMLITLTADNIESYVDQVVMLRSPLYCKTNPGYCFTCMGELFRTINQHVLTLSATDITSSFTLAALKSMHSSQARRIEIKSLNAYVY